MEDNQKILLGFGGAAGAYILYRNTGGRKRGRSPQGYTRLTSASVGKVEPYTPQSPVTLSPGESVYDPNSEGLLNTPTSGSAGNPGAWGGPFGSLPFPQSNAPGAPAYTVNVNYPKAPKGKPKLTAKGAQYAPFGHKKPRPRKGFHIKGLGSGFWEYIPNKKKKKKK